MVFSAYRGEFHITHPLPLSSLTPNTIHLALIHPSKVHSASLRSLSSTEDHPPAFLVLPLELHTTSSLSHFPVGPLGADYGFTGSQKFCFSWLPTAKLSPPSVPLLLFLLTALSTTSCLGIQVSEGSSLSLLLFF